MNDAARRMVPARLRPTHDTVCERAREAGAQALLLTGSTARRTRTEISDLDYHLVGEPIAVGDLPAELDVHVVSPSRLRARLLDGDDFTHWSLRFGLIVFDEGVVGDCIRLARERDLWPDVARKAEQARKSLRMADAMVRSGDLDAAMEQVRIALTLTARWRLLASGCFPLSRGELPGQLEELGASSLAVSLAATIASSPELQELDDWVALARRLLETPDVQAVRPHAA